jgi:hypothetical protein
MILAGFNINNMTCATIPPPTDQYPKDCITGEPLIPTVKYFVIRGSNGLPMEICMGIFHGSNKVKGHELIPRTITDKTFHFDSLQDLERYRCPCNRQKMQSL